MTKAVLYLVRHGKTRKNRSGLLQGRSDDPMSEEGVGEAEAAAAWLRENKIVFDRVFSSPLGRAVRTAEILSGGFPAILDERLLEMDYGPYEGTDMRDPPPEITEFFRDFIRNPAPAGMESLDAVRERAGSFLNDLKEEVSGTVLVSTHAIALKGLLEVLTPESKGGYWSTYIGNCDIYRTELTENGYTVPVPVYQRREPEVK